MLLIIIPNALQYSFTQFNRAKFAGILIRLHHQRPDGPASGSGD
jgi:hypothetical protein